MNWFKLLRHDLRCGLLRWRYLAVLAIFLLPCLIFHADCVWQETPESWMDYLLYTFQGKEPILELRLGEPVLLPMLWLLVMGGCLFLNLDYMLGDLTNAGQQVILRGRTRQGWFLSKCVWNLCSCGLYVCGVILVTLIFTILTGGKISLRNTPALSMPLFFAVAMEDVTLNAGQGVLMAIVLPLLTLSAFSMLEMTLCLLVKPIISFFACMVLLVISVYIHSPLILGNGAMTVRSSLVAPDGIAPGTAAVIAAAVILISVIVGTLWFQHTDILGLEE